ncbi:hypothetical protein BSLG_004292 [Batrachochytrium salamandrivorans]|nr:hypothetical protein BSLG_004292 [Batrachochytrium salamandrivorans]
MSTQTESRSMINNSSHHSGTATPKILDRDSRTNNTNRTDAMDADNDATRGTRTTTPRGRRSISIAEKASRSAISAETLATTSTMDECADDIQPACWIDSDAYRRILHTLRSGISPLLTVITPKLQKKRGRSKKSSTVAIKSTKKPSKKSSKQLIEPSTSSPSAHQLAKDMVMEMQSQSQSEPQLHADSISESAAADAQTHSLDLSTAALKIPSIQTSPLDNLVAADSVFTLDPAVIADVRALTHTGTGSCPAINIGDYIMLLPTGFTTPPQPIKFSAVTLQSTIIASELESKPKETDTPVQRKVSERVYDRCVAKSYIEQSKNLQVVIKNRNRCTNLTVPPFSSAFTDCISRERIFLNVGCSVWALEWCPGVPLDYGCQYLAVAGFRDASVNHIIGQRYSSEQHGDTAMKGAIQIWRIPAFPSDNNPSELELLILHDRGHVLHLSWCTPALFTEPIVDVENSVGSMGILAACFSDGSIAVFSVPLPGPLRETLFKTGQAQYDGHPLCYSIGASGSIQNGLIMDLNSPEMLFGASLGVTNRRILVVDTTRAITTADFDIDRDLIIGFQAHDSAVRDMCWYRRNGQPPRYLISTGQDGRLSLRDIFDPWSRLTLTRARYITTVVAWSYALNALVYSDSEHFIRTMKIGSKTWEPLEASRKSCVYLIRNTACVWRVDTSQHIPFVASASADGTLKIASMQRQNKKRRKDITLFTLECDVNDTGVIVFDEDRSAKTKWCPNINSYGVTKSTLAKTGAHGGVSVQENSHNVERIAETPRHGKLTADIGTSSVPQPQKSRSPKQIDIGSSAPRVYRSGQLLASGGACGWVRIDATLCGLATGPQPKFYSSSKYN